MEHESNRAADAAFARRADEHWQRIREVLQARDPEWPGGYGEQGQVAVCRDEVGEPCFEVGSARYLLEDEAHEPAEDRVVEVTQSRIRTLTREGVAGGFQLQELPPEEAA